MGIEVQKSALPTLFNFARVSAASQPHVEDAYTVHQVYRIGKNFGYARQKKRPKKDDAFLQTTDASTYFNLSCASTNHPLILAF